MRYERRVFLNKINNTVFVFVIAYSIFYYLIGAHFPAFTLLASALILSPLVRYVEKKCWHRAARFLFLSSCIYYVYVTPLCIRVDASVEYYFLPGMMLSLLIFDIKQRWELIVGLCIPLIGWFLVTFGVFPQVPESWLVFAFPGELFKVLNFLGAFLISGIFIFHYVNVLKKLKVEAFQSLSRAHNELVQSHQELSFKEKEMRALINTIRAGILKIDKAGVVIHANKMALDAFSLKESDIVGQKAPGVLTPILQQLELGKEIEESVIEVKDPDGNKRWFNISLSQYLENEKNHFKEVIVTLSEVTKLLLRESELEQTMAAIKQSAIVTVTDKLGKIIDANDNFCRVSGYSQKELIGARHNVIKSKAQDELFYHKLWSSISSGHIWSGEITNKNKSGQLFVLKMVISPIRDLNGEIERYISISFEITREKEIERNLEEAQEVAKVGSWVCELPDKVHRWSKQMHAILGCAHTEELVAHKSFVKAFHEDDAQKINEMFIECLQSGKPWKTRARIKKKTGDVWVEVSGQARANLENRIVAISGTCQNIHDLVVAEELTKAERTKSMHAAKLASLGEMSAGIAHEINNPLAIIAANASLMLETELPRAKAVEKIERLINASGRIAKIVGGLRKFSRTSDGKVRARHKIEELLSEVTFLTEVKAKRYGVAVKFDIQTNSELECDEIEIEQVLINLINNGIDAVSKLEEKWVEVRAFDKDDILFIHVMDSGAGIPSEVAAKIFEPFFTTKNVGEGTGLGLSIAKGIVEDHGGHLEILQKTKNTCFELRFKKAGAQNEVAA